MYAKLKIIPAGALEPRVVGCEGVQPDVIYKSCHPPLYWVLGKLIFTDNLKQCKMNILKFRKTHKFKVLLAKY